MKPKTLTLQQSYDPNQVQEYIRLLKREQESARNQTKSKKGSGSQSWLSSIISELGGAGGAAGGAAAGATLGSIVPGIGTILGGIGGGIAGGFLGGTGGRLVENQIRDKEMRIGDALKEGLLSGAFGGAGAAFQGARGAYAAGKAGGLGGRGLVNTIKGGSGLLDEAILAAEKTGGKGAARQLGRTLIGSGARTGKAVGQGVTNIDDIGYAAQKGLQSIGSRARASQRGISPLVRDMTPAQADSYNRAISSVSKWGTGIGKEGQARNLDDAMKQVINQYARSNEGAKAFGKANAKNVAKIFTQEVNADPALRAVIKKGANATKVQNILDDIAKFGSKKNKDFITYVEKVVNPKYKKAVAGGNAGSVEAKLFEALRKASKETIDESLVGRSAFNQQFATLKGATEQLGKTITKDSTQATDMTLGRILSDIVGPTKDVLGRGMQQAGKVTKYTTPMVKGATLRGALNGGEPVDMSMQDQSAQDASGIFTGEMPQGMESQGMGQQGLGGAIQGYGQSPQPQQYNPYAPQNLQSSIAQIMQQGGDMGDVKDFLSIATAMSKLTETGEQELTAIQRNKIAGYNTANTVVDSLEQLWQGVSQPGSQLAAGLSGLPGVKQARSTFDPKVRQYTQFAEGTLAPIIKSLGETGVLTDRDIIRAYGLVPNLQDSPDVASNKIQQLRALLTNAEMATADTGGGGQDALAEIIASQQQYSPY